MAFGSALRAAVEADPERFDRVQILSDTLDPVQRAAQEVLRSFGAPPQG
jgi:fructose-bisphosphate aldolase class II